MLQKEGNSVKVLLTFVSPPPRSTIHETAEPLQVASETAGRTLQGYEVMNMIRKGQIHGVIKGDITSQVTFIASLFGVAA